MPGMAEALGSMPALQTDTYKKEGAEMEGLGKIASSSCLVADDKHLYGCSPKRIQWGAETTPPIRLYFFVTLKSNWITRVPRFYIGYTKT